MLDNLLDTVIGAFNCARLLILTALYLAFAVVTLPIGGSVKFIIDAIDSGMQFFIDLFCTIESAMNFTLQAFGMVFQILMFFLPDFKDKDFENAGK